MKKLLPILLLLVLVFLAARFGHMLIPYPDPADFGESIAGSLAQNMLAYGDILVLYLLALALFVTILGIRPAIKRRRTGKDGEPLRFYFFLTGILFFALAAIIPLLVVFELFVLLFPDSMVVQFLLGSPVARVFFALLAGYFLASAVVLAPIYSLSLFSVDWLMREYPGFARPAAARHTFDVKLGIHASEYRVFENKITPTLASAGILALLGGPGVLITDEGHAVITMRSGKVERVVGTGITFLKPFERPHQVVYLMGRPEKVEAKNVVTRDHIVIPEIALRLFHRLDRGKQTHENGRLPFDDQIIRERVWSPNAGDWRESIKAVAEGALRDVIARHPLEEVVSVGDEARKRLRAELIAAINTVAINLGITVITADLGEIKLPHAAEEQLLARGLSEVKRRTALVDAGMKYDEAVAMADAKRYETMIHADGESVATLTLAEAERKAAMLKAEAERVKQIADAETAKQTKITVSEGDRQARLNEAEAEKLMRLLTGEADQKNQLRSGEVDKQVLIWKAEAEQQEMLLKGRAEATNQMLSGQAVINIQRLKGEADKQVALRKGEAEKEVLLLKGEAERQVTMWKGEAKADSLSREEYARAQGAAERIRQLLGAFQQRQMGPQETSTLIISVLRENEVRRSRSLAWLEQQAYQTETETDMRAAANDNRRSSESIE